MRSPFPTHPKCPSSSEGAGRGQGAGGREAGASTGHCKLAGRAPGSSPGPGSPPPAPRAPPDLGGRAGAVATNERARRLWEPGRLCPPGIGHAVGSGGRGLGGPRAWLGQACCWVTGRRVSPGNGGGYRSLAGREGGGGAGAGRPRRPQQQRAAPAPAGSGNLHTRRPLGPCGRQRPRPAPTGSGPASGLGRPATQRGPRRPPLHRGRPGLRLRSEKLSPSQLPLAVPRNHFPGMAHKRLGEGAGLP